MHRNFEKILDWYHINQKILGRLELITEQYRISFSAFMIIDQLYQNEDLSPKCLAEILEVSKPAISRKLNMLQARGYIRKLRGENCDQRIIKLTITALGEETYLKIINGLENQINVTDADITLLNKLLAQFD